MDLYVICSSYLGLSALLGLWNRWKGNGFLLGFFYSLMLTPFIGVLTIALSSNIKLVHTARGIMRVCPHCFALTPAPSSNCEVCSRHIYRQTVKDFLHLGELFVGLLATIIVVKMLMKEVTINKGTPERQSTVKVE